MGCYLTTAFAQCQVYLSRVPLQGGSMYHAGLPSVQGTIVYDAEAFNNLYPGYIAVPLLCKGRSGAPSSPPVPPAPPANPDPPAPPEPGPITGDPPPEACGAGPGIIKDDKTTSSSWWNGGSSAAKTDGKGAFDRMAQPLVLGITPVPQYDADAYTAKPVYTQEPHFEIRTGEKHAIADVYHEGTGVGALVFHPPELLDFQLHGDGSNPGSRWATNLSESMLLLHSAAAVNGGDDSFTVLAFGGLHRTKTNRPKKGVYFRYTPGSPGIFTLAGTAVDTTATDRNHFRLDDLCFDLGQYATANLAALSPRAGSLVWNTTSSEVQYYNGSAWVAFGGGSVTFPLQGPDDGDPAYMFDGATVPGSDLAGMKFDTTDSEGPGLFDINGDPQLRVLIDEIVIPGKLTLGTDLAIADGGTGQSTAQAAIDALTQVSGATNEYVLTKDTATGNAKWKAAASGSGDVVGPASATDNVFPRYDGTTGKLLQDGEIVQDDVSFSATIVHTKNVISANSVALNIRSGTTTTSGDSGNVALDAGSAAGTAGQVNIATGNASALTMGRSGISTVLNGNVFMTNMVSQGSAGATTTDNTTGVTTGISFALTTGEYIITIMARLTSAGTATAPRFAMKGTGGLVVGSFDLRVNMHTTATGMQGSNSTALGTFTAGTTGPGPTARPCAITCRVRVTTAGTITLWMRSETSGSAVTLVEGSGYAIKVA